MQMHNDNHRLRIFTWHVHGSYLYYLSQGDYDLYIPVNKVRDEGYYGRGKTFPFGNNVIEVEAAEVRNLDFDCILFQSSKNFLIDQYEILSARQRRSLPKIYLEHNVPSEDAVSTVHPMKDPDVILVHVTHFNKLMWNSNACLIKVIEHGVSVNDVQYRGDLEKGIVVVNNMEQRGRTTGWDIFDFVRKKIPLDLVGMGTIESGGLGEILHPGLPAFMSGYRFLFNPIRYTSLDLSVCEAMMIGMPIVSLATTEYVTVIQNGLQGFISTNVDELIMDMMHLLYDPRLARRMGHHAFYTAGMRFNITRFISDWEETFRWAINNQNKYEPFEEKNSIYQ